MLEARSRPASPFNTSAKLGEAAVGPSNSFCGSDAVVIGFNMRSGTALDAINPICIRLNDQGTEWTGEAYEASLQYRGGPGGGYQKIACNPGDAVRHFHVYAAGPWGDSTVVEHVRMTCEDLGNPANWYNVVPQQIAGTVTMDQRFSCGDGYWAAGLYGRTGALVDRLGFGVQENRASRSAATSTAAAATSPSATTSTAANILPGSNTL